MSKETYLNKFSVIALAVLLSGLLAFTGLSQESAKRGGTVAIPHGDVSVPVMDPHQADDMGEESIAFLVADPLFRLQKGELVPYLAKGWESSEDGQVYTIRLREDVKFHNGEEFTAADVKKNIRRILDNDLPSKGDVSDVETMEVVDDHTIKINLKDTNPVFLYTLANIKFCEPESWQNLEEGEPVIGTGAFKYVPEKYAPESEMVLERFDDYWKGEPYLDNIVVKVTGGREATLTQLRKGVVDFATYISFKDANLLEEKGFDLHVFGKINWANIAINLSEVELPVRKAINYAFNPKPVINAPTVFAGYGEVQRNLGYPGSYLELESEEYSYGYDPEKARNILEEAGWKDTDGDGIRERDGEKLELSFPTRTGMGWAEATQMIQGMLKKVGIGSEIETAPSSTFYDMVRQGDYDIAWWLQNGTAMPPIATYSWDCREYWQVSQKCFDDFQNLLEKAEAAVDREKRAELFKELQRVYYERAMGALGVWTKQIDATSPSLNGFKVTRMGHFYNSYRWWIEE